MVKRSVAAANAMAPGKIVRKRMSLSMPVPWLFPVVLAQKWLNKAERGR
jgi:hypothetical protein